MSTRPQVSSGAGGDPRGPVSLPRIAEMRNAGQPIVMVTAYDFPSAQVVEEAAVDMVLVGDSAAMTVLGYDSTVPVGMEEMLFLTSAVRRGLKTPLLIGDMPFGSYETSNEDAVRNAQRFVK
ncbi:MAG: 3-methyl-2-oxobutanoate hydroxymethyltransferase, partial [Solirubrobacterales bacterium]